MGEIDTLTGGGLGGEALDAAADNFVLGDSNNVYYLGEGSNDYAIIKGFETSTESASYDHLTLKGSSSSYSVEDKNLYYNNDLIAAFDDKTVALFALNSAIFV